MKRARQRPPEGTKDSTAKLTAAAMLAELESRVEDPAHVASLGARLLAAEQRCNDEFLQLKTRWRGDWWTLLEQIDEAVEDAYLYVMSLFDDGLTDAGAQALFEFLPKWTELLEAEAQRYSELQR